MQKPQYVIEKADGVLDAMELRHILNLIPLEVTLSPSSEFSLTERMQDPDGWASERKEREPPTLRVTHKASLISIHPPQGQRISHAIFEKEKAHYLTPSRVMDESTGGGACCSYVFDKKRVDGKFVLVDIYKF